MPAAPPAPRITKWSSTGTTGHAESVQIKFDPSQVTYGQILRVYFSVAHDPTELDRQGPDEGTQYRSNIFYTSDAQKKIAEAYIAARRQGACVRRSDRHARRRLWDSMRPRAITRIT
jgi:methionine-S-sulfoxide reductase